MRKLFALAVFAASSVLAAQQSALPNAPQPRDWQSVQALRPGSSIHVKAQQNSATCRLKSADAESLTCTGAKDLIFQRAEIRSVAVPHRGRSALIGLAIGGGVGAITGFAIGTGGNNNSFFGKNAFRGDISAFFAAIGGVAGTGVGALTDFAHSTVYKAP